MAHKQHPAQKGQKQMLVKTLTLKTAITNWTSYSFSIIISLIASEAGILTAYTRFRFDKS